jgi:hypothetical protein
VDPLVLGGSRWGPLSSISTDAPPNRRVVAYGIRDIASFPGLTGFSTTTDIVVAGGIAGSVGTLLASDHVVEGFVEIHGE